MTGKANLEVRPTFINKGEIAKRLVQDHPADAPPEFILCLGDDFTDEDMFRSLNNAGLDPQSVYTVTVGASSKMTLAHWHLLEPADVISTVALLAGGNEPEEDQDEGARAVMEGRAAGDLPGGKL